MRRILPYILVLLALLLVPTMAVTAQQQVDGNPTCADLGYSGYEYKLEPPTPGLTPSPPEISMGWKTPPR